jgi:hypothetical protein
LLKGSRCKDSSCACRKPGDDLEKDPPAAGMKRLEVRLSFLGGKGALSSPSLGLMPAENVVETCYYVDVPGGSTSAVRFEGQAQDENAGFTPHVAIAEYGPPGPPAQPGQPSEGPYWYEVMTVDCVGVGGRCDKAGSEAWVASLRGRKRGRIDPCGSMVVHNLKWDTSGGLSHRDNGYYRDFQVTFDLEAKKFTPKFAPNSTECIPK